MKNINPIINISNRPVNIDYSLESLREEKQNLYSINVSEENLSMSFIGMQNSTGELIITKPLLLIFHGFDSVVDYPPEIRNGDICLDPSIKKDFFQKSLSLYDISLKELEMRSMNYFFTNEFTIGIEKREELYQLINQEFKK